MPWPGQPFRLKTPTAGCSARRTRTTTSARARAPFRTAGGTDGVPCLISMPTPSVVSGMSRLQAMSNSVACWSKSTSLQFKHLFVSSTLTTMSVKASGCVPGYTSDILVIKIGFVLVLVSIFQHSFILFSFVYRKYHHCIFV